MRLGKYVDVNLPDDVVGIRALRQIKASGPKRQQLGIILDDETPTGTSFIWFDISSGSGPIGKMTNIAWSYRLKKNIGFALVTIAAKAGDRVTVMRNGKSEPATLAELPFL